VYLSGSTCEGLLLENLSTGHLKRIDRADLPANLDPSDSGRFRVDCLDALGGAWMLDSSWQPRRGPVPIAGTPIVPGTPVNFADPIPDSAATRLVLYNGAVDVYAYPGGTLLQSIPPVDPSAEVFMRPTAAHMVPGGWSLVFTQRYPSGLRVVHPDGTTLWLPGTFPLTGSFLAWDGDGDGRDEVYMVSGRRLLRLHPSGTLDTLLTSTQNLGRPALSLQPDTALWLTAQVNGQPHLLRYRFRDGGVDTLPSLLWGGHLYVGQLDPQPDEDVVLVSTQGVEMRHGDGTLLDTLRLPLQERWVALLDRDGNGISELYLSVREGAHYRILGLTPAGDTVFASTVQWDRGLAFGTPMTGCDSLLFYGNRGDELWGWGTSWEHLRMPGKTAGSVTVLPGEIRVVSWLRAGFHIFSVPTTCAGWAWPMADHDPRRTRNPWVQATPFSLTVQESSTPQQFRLPAVFTRTTFLSRFHTALRRGTLLLVDPSGRLYRRPGLLRSGVYWMIWPSRNTAQKVLILP